MSDLISPVDLCDASKNVPYSISSYNVLLLCIGCLAAVVTHYALTQGVQAAEANNRLDYDSKYARILAGLFRFVTACMHTKNNDLELADTAGALLAIGPHRTALEAVVVATKMKGAPPRFFATDSFDAIPGVAAFLNMFKTLKVKASKPGTKGAINNTQVIDDACAILEEKGCVALFPQGGFDTIGANPRKIYDGAAKIALRQNIPIQVIRLDGFWSLENSLFPLWVRNSKAYRAFFSVLHMNDIRTTVCPAIDFHLKPENQHLNDKEKMEHINAQLYLYFHSTKNLTAADFAVIAQLIADNHHLTLWRNKVSQCDIEKKIIDLKKEGELLEEVEIIFDENMFNTMSPQ